MEFLVQIIFAAILGLIPAAIARNKGRDFLTWWVYGTMLCIVALPHALLLQPQIEETPYEPEPVSNKFNPAQFEKKCMDCAETIKLEAKVCHYCGHRFTDKEMEEDIAKAQQSHRLKSWKGFSTP